MTASKRTSIALMILGLVSAGVLGYLIWSYLAPPPIVSVSLSVPSTDIKIDAVTDTGFQKLEPYAVLPVAPVNVGRVDPFAPFVIKGSGADLNMNINAR